MNTYPCAGKVLGHHVSRLLLVDEDDDRRWVTLIIKDLKEPLSVKYNKSAKYPGNSL